MLTATTTILVLLLAALALIPIILTWERPARAKHRRLFAKHVVKAIAEGGEPGDGAIKSRHDQMLRGIPRNAAAEYRLVETLAAAAPNTSGDSGSRLRDVAAAYRSFAAALSRSLLVRTALPDVVGREAGLAERVARRLEARADSVRIDYPRGGAAADSPNLSDVLRRFGVTVLVGPPEKDATAMFDSIRTEFRDTWFGPASFGYDEAVGDDDPRWGKNWLGLAGDQVPQAVQRLRYWYRHYHDLVQAGAHVYNGTLLRYEGWSVESSSTGPGRTLVLHCAQTSHLACVATQQRLRDKRGDRDVDLPVEEGDAAADEVMAAGDLQRLALDSKDEFLGEGRVAEHCAVANALSVHLAVITADAMLVLTRRGRVDIEPGRLNSAVNGTPEAPGETSSRGDVDDDGFVDVIGATFREANEEIGRHLRLARERVGVRALIVAREGDRDTPRQIGPHVVLDARTSLTFDELARGFLGNACRHEGAFEVDRFVGLPLSAGPYNLCRWLKAHAATGDLTSGGLASSLFALAPIFGGSSELADHWHRALRGAPPIERVIDPLRP